MSQQVYISDVIREVVEATSDAVVLQLQEAHANINSVRFDYGHYNDIQERLTAMSKTSSKFERYPLIAMFEDYRIRHGKEGLTGIADLKLIILFPSKKEITREQRESNVFRPILYPIYFEFLKQLKLSGKFQIYDETKIKHYQINRPHWGDPALYANTSYLFGEVLDGIELSNLELETYLDNCV